VFSVNDVPVILQPNLQVEVVNPDTTQVIIAGTWTTQFLLLKTSPLPPIIAEYEEFSKKLEQPPIIDEHLEQRDVLEKPPIIDELFDCVPIVLRQPPIIDELLLE
jgi:hypothetical protein